MNCVKKLIQKIYYTKNNKYYKNNIDAKNILYFSYLAQLDLLFGQKDQAWLHKMAKI